MRTVAVASGKGGTGKTTVTALFAHLASQRQVVSVVDADVEASNLPLALGAHGAACTAFPGMPAAHVDLACCNGCGACASSCRFGAIQLTPDSRYRVDAVACEGCGRCASVCPAGAITMVPGSAGEACEGDCTVGPIAFGQLGPGEDLSGRLVTEARRLGLAAATRESAGLLLIDGPPGVGCPLIAAIASADLVVAVAEPTISGAHDLARLADVAARVNLPMRVVLNKADLSADGAERLRQLCASRDLPVLAEVPFEPELATVLESLATAPRAEMPEWSPAQAEVAGAWRTLERELEL